MREIKFRGKTISTSRWVYGDLVRDMSFHPDKGPETCVICWGNDYCSVDPSTVGQLTGLKDKNGTEIFEGDILETLESPYDNIYRTYRVKVIFKDGCFQVEGMREDIDDGDYLWDISEASEVIGSAYSNPPNY